MINLISKAILLIGLTITVTHLYKIGENYLATFLLYYTITSEMNINNLERKIKNIIKPG